MAEIYISYRRTDSSDIAGRIYDYLVQRYSRNDIFMDVASLPLGVNFAEYIQNVVAQCSVMLVIIGPNWLEGHDQRGRGRVPDLIQNEIEAGFSHNLLVIPVLVRGASMPWAVDLPGSIASLTYLNAHQIRRDPDFRSDMESLISSIGRVLPAREPVRESSHGLFWWLSNSQKSQRKRSQTSKELEPPAPVEAELPTITTPVDTQKSPPASIFISYKAEDRPIISTLASELSERGFMVWYDQRLMGGHLWWNEILANIASADAFVFGLTPAALDSVPCQREYGYAHALRKRILPLLLVDDIDMRYLPPALQQIQGVRYRDSDATTFGTLSEALNNLPAAVTLPDPLPDPPPAPISPLGAIKEQLDAPELSLEQQAVMLHQLRTLMKAQNSSDDALRLLRELADHRDARTSITNEIRDILG